MNLELYRYYTRGEIFDVFKDSQPTEAEGWFLSAQRLIGLFAIGARPPEIHFCNDSRFHWYGRGDESVPQPIQDFKNLKGAYLFVKSPTEDRYAYVSRVQHVGMHGGGPNGFEAAMDITPRIPTDLLHELGGLYFHPDGEGAMNRPVAALRTAMTPDERFAAFREFVEFWRGPVEAGHALSEDDLAQSPLPIPAILKRLYLWAGACDDVMNAGYLSIRKPFELSVDDNQYVAFCVECQWCGNYYVRRDALQDDDPEVFADECGDTRKGAGYHGTGIGLSQFLWAYYIAFNVDGGPISCHAELVRDEYARFLDLIEPLPVLAEGSQSCRAIQAYRSKIGKKERAVIFAQDGVMGYLIRQEDSRRMQLVSKTQRAVDNFVALLGIDMSRVQRSN